eukprot:9324547-Pyramimonas_sp.AAC.1
MPSEQEFAWPELGAARRAPLGVHHDARVLPHLHAVAGPDATQWRHHRLRERRGRWPHGHVGRPVVAAPL